MTPPPPLSSDLPHFPLPSFSPGGLRDPLLPSAPSSVLSRNSPQCTGKGEGVRGSGALPAGETCSSSAGAICRELAGWPPSGPWLLPTVTPVTHKLLWVPARFEENDLNFFLLLVLFCWFILCFHFSFFGVFRVGRAPGRDTATSVGIFLIPGTQRLQPLSS